MKMKTMGLEYVIDPRLGNNYPKTIYDDIIKLAMDCASFHSEDRPSMKVKYCDMYSAKYTQKQILIAEFT